MFEVNKIKKIIKKYPDIFDRIINNYEIDTVTKDKIVFKNSYDSTLEITLEEENSTKITIKVKEKNKVISKIHMIDIPKKDCDPIINTKETIIEERKNGIIIEYINRCYEFTEYSTKKRYVTLLSSTRYVLEALKNYIDLSDEKIVKKLASFKSGFSSLLYSYSIYEGKFKETNNLVQNDKKSLSNIYASIKGPEQIETVYDLYNGVINERTKEILLTHNKKSLDDLYDYKSKCGITEKEAALVGERVIDQAYEEYVKKFIQTQTYYPEKINVASRESIINALKYKPTTSEISKKSFERMTGIPYEEFDELDFDDQQKIIKEARTRNKLFENKSNTTTMMIGSGEYSTPIKVKKGEKCLIGAGEHSCFIEAGLTPEEEKRRLNAEIDSISTLELPKLKEKVKSIFRRNN